MRSILQGGAGACGSSAVINYLAKLIENGTLPKTGLVTNTAYELPTYSGYVYGWMRHSNAEVYVLCKYIYADGKWTLGETLASRLITYVDGITSFELRISNGLLYARFNKPSTETVYQSTAHGIFAFPDE